MASSHASVGTLILVYLYIYTTKNKKNNLPVVLSLSSKKQHLL